MSRTAGTHTRRHRRAEERAAPNVSLRSARYAPNSGWERVFAGNDMRGSFPGAPVLPCVFYAFDDEDHIRATPERSYWG